MVLGFLIKAKRTRKALFKLIKKTHKSTHRPEPLNLAEDSWLEFEENRQNFPPPPKSPDYKA